MIWDLVLMDEQHKIEKIIHRECECIMHIPFGLVDNGGCYWLQDIVAEEHEANYLYAGFGVN